MTIAPFLTAPERTDSLFDGGRLIYDALSTPAAAVVYRVGEELAARFRAKVIVKSTDEDFNVEEFANAGLCALHPHPVYHADMDARWYPDPGVINRSYDQAWYRIIWRVPRLRCCGSRFRLPVVSRPRAG
jgi:hypothetical protein